MKACSFLPAATSMIYQMGLQNHLFGVTFECPSDKPRIIHSYLEEKHYTSLEIEKIVSAARAMGQCLYCVEEELLQTMAPDVIFTQDVCDVCQIGTSHVQKAISKLKKQPVVISLTPRRLQDVLENAITIAAALGKEEAAYRHLQPLQKKLHHITDQLRKHHAPVKRVMVMEWIDPIYNCGHWIPDQIVLAGGVDMLSNPGGYSIITGWEKVRLYNPEVLVIAPCGFSIDRAQKELALLVAKEGWAQLLAVQNKAVFLADADLFTQPSTTLVNGIELLAALFHPEIFGVPAPLQHKYLPVHQLHAIPV